MSARFHKVATASWFNPPADHAAGRFDCARENLIMRILIQKKDSGFYFRDIEDWTASSVHAMDFLSSTAAIEFCVLNKIKGVHLVLKFEEEHHEIVMPFAKDKLRPREDGLKL